LSASLSQQIAELRRALPASVLYCREAILDSDGDISRAYDILLLRLTNEVAERTGASQDEASAKLRTANFDMERAVELWNRENPPPEPTAREKLMKGLEMAAAVPFPDPQMRRYAHVIPNASGYELRLITHHARYTEETFGLDYDYAIEDLHTRVKRVFAVDLQSTLAQLAAWGCTEAMLASPRSIDSCLVNSPLEAYLHLPHLQMVDDPEVRPTEAG